LIKDLVIADDGHVFELALCDQHPVEGIAVLASEATCTLCMKQRDVERRETLTGDAAGDIRRDIERSGQVAEPGLRRDFPRRRCTAQDAIRPETLLGIRVLRHLGDLRG
jgi:hypothetical protein